MTGSDRLTTFEMGSRYGVSPGSLRFYEEQGILNPFIDNNIRYFSPRDRVKLELIIKGKSLGFSLLEVKMMILSTLEERASSAMQTSQTTSLSKSVEAEDIAEEIWRAEQSIDRLRSRILTLRKALEGENDKMTKTQ